MDSERLKRRFCLGYLAASVAVVFIAVGLFGLPFFRMDGLFLKEEFMPMSASAFALMGSVLSPAQFRFGDNDTSYVESVNKVLGLYYAGGVLHWLLLIVFCALLVFVVLAVVKKKMYRTSPLFLAATALSFSLLIVFAVMANRVNALYQTYLGVGFTSYRFFSDSEALFGVTAAAFLAAVFSEQLALSDRGVFRRKQKLSVSESSEREIYYAKDEESRVIIINDKSGIRENAVGAPRFEISVGIKNAEAVESGDRMNDIVLKIGVPQYVDENLVAYWWRSARSRTEYLINKLSDVPDSELKIPFDSDNKADKIVLNVNGGSFSDKNVKEQRISEKRELYSAEELPAALKGAVVSFYDGSFIKLARPEYRVIGTGAGIAEIMWEAEGLSFRDTVPIREK